MIIHTSMTKINEEPKWLESGNSLLDLFIKQGLPSEKISFVVGKSRNIGKSYTHKRLWMEWKKTNRLMKIKRYFNNIK